MLIEELIVIDISKQESEERYNRAIDISEYIE